MSMGFWCRVYESGCVDDMGCGVSEGGWISVGFVEY